MSRARVSASRKPAVADEQPVVEEDALLLDGAAEGGHGAGGDAADLGVVAARGDQEAECPSGIARLVEHRGHDGHVGQVGAAVVRVVDGVHVAGPQVVRAPPQDLLDGLAHGAEVDGDVGRVGDEVALGVEEGAGEVEAFLDVDRVGGVLQAHAHLLGDGHEEAVEDLQEDRVHVRPRGHARGARCDAVQEEVSAVGRGGPPAGVDDGRGVGLGEERGAVDGVAGAEVLAPVEGVSWGVPPLCIRTVARG